MNLVVDLPSLDDIGTLADMGIGAIICSDSHFGVRSEVTFSQDELSEIRVRTKNRKIRMMVNVNAIFHENELNGLLEYLRFLKFIDVDAVIFSDMAVYKLSQKIEITKKLVYSAETLITNSFDMNFWLDRIDSVVLSNELSLDELRMMSSQAKKDVIFMVYGYHSMFYSKRALLSNYFEYKNEPNEKIQDNRNLRIKEETRSEEYPILEDARGTHIFTGKIFCLFGELGILAETKCKQWWIRSNFLDKGKYFDIIRLYRQAIDEIRVNNFEAIKEHLMEKVIKIDSNIDTSHLYAKSVLIKGVDE